MAKDIYFNDKRNGSSYTEQNSSWNSEAFREKLSENCVTAAPDEKPKKRTQPPKKKHKKLKAVLCFFLALILVLSAIVVGGTGYILKGYENSELTENTYVSSSMLKSSPAVMNILLMGVDNADLHSNSRSDSMILLSVDTLHGKLKLTSFMRDMFIEVPEYGKTKLTHACQYGGAQLTVDTIETNFGIKIDAYAKIGYDFLIDLVEGIGGITVPEIDSVEAAALAREKVEVTPGENIHLNGFETLQYCRIRKGQSDFQRTERQREAITLIIKKALRTNPLKLLKIASEIVAKVDCSIPKAEIISTGLKILPCLTGEIEQQQLPADGEWWNDSVSGMSVLQIDLEANKEILNNFIYG